MCTVENKSVARSVVFDVASHRYVRHESNGDASILFDRVIDKLPIRTFIRIYSGSGSYR